MKKYIYAYVITSTVWCSGYALYVSNRSENMSLLQNILIGTIPALVTGAITAVATLHVAKKNRLNNNTDALKALKESNERTFNTIKEDIGRGTFSSATLTEQHKNLQDEIRRDFSVIQKRYEKEDAVYDKYSRQQLDIEGAVKAYLEEYKRLIAENNDMSSRIVQLELEIEALKNQQQQSQSQEQTIRKGMSR